jgi:hypothetical protein
MLPRLGRSYAMPAISIANPKGGAGGRMVSRAIARSDLVLIPMQTSAVDAAQATSAVGLVKEDERVLGRAIPPRVVMTENSPQIPTRNEELIPEELQGSGVPLPKAHLNQRTPTSRCSRTYRRSTSSAHNGQRRRGCGRERPPLGRRRGSRGRSRGGPQQEPAHLWFWGPG